MIALGIDIGGTSTKFAAVKEDGSILFHSVYQPTHPVNGEEYISELLDRVEEKLSNFKKGEVTGIGIGCPGAIDTVAGVCDRSGNLNWDHLPIVRMFEDRLHIPTKITNDANAAILAEAKFGAGKRFKNIVMLTLGTGVGGGLFIDGKLYEGVNGKGAELGHASLVLGGRPCTCGRKGCIETYCSATAIIKEGNKAMEANPQSELNNLAKNNGGKLTCKMVFDAEKQGDETAHKVIEEYVSYLGEACLDFCNIFRPEAILLSGGVAKQGDILAKRVDDYCRKRLYGFPYTPEVKILIANLGADTGIIGAAALFF